MAFSHIYAFKQRLISNLVLFSPSYKSNTRWGFSKPLYCILDLMVEQLLEFDESKTQSTEEVAAEESKKVE